LVFIKKNQTEIGSNRPVLVWFFMKKPVQTGLARFFAGLARFFPVWVRFGFRLIKPKPNRPVFSKF